MGIFDKIAKIQKEIREASRESKILGETSKFYALQADRYFKLAGLLDKSAADIERHPEPRVQDQDTF
jgi:hypothetical protein